MSFPQDLRLVDDDAVAAGAKPPPRVFVRSLSAPPGLPWDQARAVDLEARMGAPLPLAGVAYQLRRLEPWRPGRPSRFAAFYVRAEEIGERLVTTMDVDGRPLEVRFVSEPERARQAKVLAGAAGGVGLILLIGVVATAFALGARAQSSARMAAVEQQADGRLHQARRIAALKLQTRTLDGARVKGRELARALDDLAMVSAAKAPGAHIQAFHWDRGYAAVEVRGDGDPLAQIDRRVQRADRQVRPGVWLWGIAPAGAPVTAQAADGGAR